jgi:hypothetical protein
LQRIIGDRGYDSDPLDQRLRQQHGIELIAPHRVNRSKPPTQDRRRLRRYRCDCQVKNPQFLPV